MRSVKIPLCNHSLCIFNLMRDFQLINLLETQQIILQKDIIIQVESQQNQENKKAFNLIKDNVINILIVHQQQVLRNFKDLFEKEVTSAKINLTQDFYHIFVTNKIKSKYFVINIVEQYQSAQVDQYLTNKQIQNFKFSYKDRFAKCLNYLLEKFKQKYQESISKIDRIFLNRLNKIILNIDQKQTQKQLLKAYLIIKYFIDQNLNQLYLKFVEQLCNFIWKLEYTKFTIQKYDLYNNELVGLIYMSLRKILIKIMNGQAFQYQKDKQYILQFINNITELIIQY
ncbi:unnamed protein product [Paramecium primaurelia]|uniref:Uncharacterized protein n=1 Tax=Paramecium primaurelia TaxID=5886 RepID=A0A8S1K827_PARPR|nr:unnamed protein product [Paramecium primaurelia]